MPILPHISEMHPLLSPVSGNLSLVWILGVFIIIAYIDSKKRIIPNVLLILALLGGIGLDIFSNEQVLWLPRVWTSAGEMTLLYLFWLRYKNQFGFGDVKMMVCAGFFLPIFAWIVFILIACCVALLWHQMSKANRAESFPFGPFICIGYACITFLYFFS